MERKMIALTPEQYQKLQAIKEAQEEFFGRRTTWGEFLLRAAAASGPTSISGTFIGGPTPHHGAESAEARVDHPIEPEDPGDDTPAETEPLPFEWPR